MGTAHTRAQNKYISKKYDRVGVLIQKDGSDGFTLEQLRDASTAAGQSVNGFILDAIRGRICSGAPAAGGIMLSLGNDGPDLEQIRRAAEREGLSVDDFICYAIKDKI